MRAALPAALLLAAGLAGAASIWPAGAPRVPDMTDAGAMARGRVVYLLHCAGCHGRYLQGQALWRVQDAHRGARAPALDQTGRAWQRSEPELVSITGAGLGAMPALGGVLSRTDVLDVVGYIEARWPSALRVMQASRSPQHARLSVGRDPGWVFPRDCD